MCKITVWTLVVYWWGNTAPYHIVEITGFETLRVCEAAVDIVRRDVPSASGAVCIERP